MAETGCKLAIVTMVFPAPTETFASIEFSALRDLGMDLKVYTMRPPLFCAGQLTRERALEELPVSQGRWAQQIYSIFLLARHPVVATSLLSFLIAHGWRRPKQLAVGLMMLPRSVQIYFELCHDRVDVLHLYWGHFPSLVGYLVQRFSPDLAVSTSLSAYDLTMDFPCSWPVAKSSSFVRTWAAANVDAISRNGVPRDQIRVCLQGIDLAAYPSKSTEKDNHQIVTCGRLIPEKGMHHVIHVFHELVGNYPDLRLRIIGDGPDRRRLESLADELRLSDRVTFLGHIAHDRVLLELADAGVFIFLSEYVSDRVPNVVKEAMASWCSCFVTPTKGIDELVEDQTNGTIVSTESTSAIAAKIGSMLDNELKMSQIQRAARGTVERDFDSRQTVTTLIDAWTEALPSNQSCRVSE
ncbi:MAG: glycosyltransferase [Pirellulaceae bacterium]|jgi:glycosyltransferase involved in cell wall biosynthesis|nr:glycosyltransferase [Pirellulaceae bacterium]